LLRLTAFGVRNLRSLRDTGLIHIKPITILVGKNSSGKSTFARILPLLKQSAERRKQAPLLWFGRLVDFGSFAEAASSFASVREIELKLRFSAPAALFVGSRASFLGEEEASDSPSPINVRMLIGSTGEDDRTVLRQLELDVFGVTVKIVNGPGDAQVTVGDTIASCPRDSNVYLIPGAIIPLPHVFYREALSATPAGHLGFQPRLREGLGSQEVRAAISHFVHGNTLAETKDEIAERLPIAGLATLLESCRGLVGAPETWRSNLEQMSEYSRNRHIKALQEALILYKLEGLLFRLDEAVQSLCTGVSYLEPLRATAQRYYRREEVSIDELDPKGLNTAFFVQGLSLREREALNSWLKDVFGFTLNVRNAGGHTSLNIETEDGSPSRNMADVGLGYSQIAPVALQLWNARQRLIRRPVQRPRGGARQRNDARSIVVIEQPELHLHPAYQARLADVLTACITEPVESTKDVSRPRMEIIAETHSSTLINRLGELIGEKRLATTDVQVLVFEPEAPGSIATQIRIAEFDDKGVLQNWPIGFFDY
jgi:hypothetical protein